MKQSDFMSANSHTQGQKGMVLVVVLLLVAVLTILGLTSMQTTSTDLQINSNYRMSEQTLYAAEAGAEYGVNRLRAALAVLHGSTSSVVPPVLNGYAFQDTGSFLAASGGVVQKEITGIFSGLTAFCQKYILTSVVLKNNTKATATVVYDMEDQLIPLFQFGIFYENDLEIVPGATMTFSGGRIHSNHDIYMFAQGTNTLSIDSIITTAGSIIHNRKDSSPGTVGYVQIKDAAGTYQPLNIDSSTPTWNAEALARWNGRVKTDVHGVGNVNLPLPAGGQPINILGTDSESLYSKSGLKIINGVARDKNGYTIDLTAGGTLVNPISTTSSFNDGRENKTMRIVQVDIAALKTNPVAMAALNDPPDDGEAGILYVSSTSAHLTNPAVRLINGGTLPTGGLSVVTNNPLYIKGDYNTANGPAGIFCDAVTILSNSWSDANSTKGISSRVASNTLVNAAIMAGNRDTVGTQYSGGVENFVRFLENWSGKTLTYSGSLTCLWQSQQATGNWPGTGTVYNPPVRNWSYGISLANLPPGTPRVRFVERTAWRQVFN
jgi:hypothetical protein